VRQSLVRLLCSIVVVGGVAYAAQSAMLGVPLPAWELVADGEPRDAVVERARPLARQHAFRCSAPEVFVHAEAVTIDDALPHFTRQLPTGMGDGLAEEGDGWRIGLVSGTSIMFERLSVMVEHDGGVWLVIC
jgi:hypothetical protein